MSEEQEGASLRRAVIEIEALHAEIERLKADWRQQAETAQLRLQKIESQNHLITELADALEETNYDAFLDPLIQRAREAAKE